MKILQLKITKSELFGESLLVNFSNKMTCIMGGRGAGKTTILSLIKWCLMDDSQFTKSELNLIKSNLGSGTVEVVVELKSGIYTFIKNWGAGPYLKDASGNIVSQLESIFPAKFIDYYSAGSIEQIGTDSAQRMKIIDGAVGSKIEEINRSITILRAEIEKNQSELFYSREEYKNLNQEILQLSSTEAALKEAQENLAKNTSNEKEKEEFDQGLAKQRIRQIEVEDLVHIAAIASAVIDEGMKYGSFLSNKLLEIDKLPISANENITDWVNTIKRQVNKIAADCNASVFDINGLKENLQTFAKDIHAKHKSEDMQFAEVRKRLESNRELYQKVTSLSEAVTKLGMLKNKIKDVVEKGRALQAHRKILLGKLQSLYYEKTKARIGVAEKLNNLIGKEIKIAIVPFGDKSNLENFVREVISLGKMKVTNEHLLWELSTPGELLAAINENKVSELAQQLNLSPDRMETIGKVISLHEKKHELESIVCDDLVNFYLKTDVPEEPSSYRPTEYLSLGQRCTAVLPILFSISDVPLIIDQPEDNLDNRFVAETIHKIIRAAKENRQLTFVTHNPNIPVVADSDHNVFLNYIDGRSSVLSSGSVDQVKDEIVNLLEGGREAFNQRKICYAL